MSSRRRSLRRLASAEPDELPSPRKSRRTALLIQLGLDNEDLKEDDNDDEYTDDKIEEDEEDEKSLVEEDNDEEEELEEEEEEEDDDDEEQIRTKKRSRSKSQQPVEEEEEEESTKHKQSSKSTPTAKEDAELEIVNDEYELPPDPQGELKVNENGELLGGRQYRIKTFTVHGKGARLYMLSTELARLMGFRDSYLFFQKHRKLYKYITTDKQKLDLVERGIMPLSYKLRTIGLITSRSAFREFGAKIIQNGKQVTDDYYEAQARENGGVEGNYAVPPLEYHPGGSTVGNNELSGLTSSSTRQDHAKEASSIEFKKFIRSTPENWIYNIATSTVHLNHFYNTSRPKFIKDLYTNVKFIPLESQPSKVTITRVANSTRGELVFDTQIKGDFKKRKFGLADLEDSIFEDCVDEETKLAIKRQRELEKTLV